VGSGRAFGGVDLGVVVYLSDVGSDSEGGIFFREEQVVSFLWGTEVLRYRVVWAGRGVGH